MNFSKVIDVMMTAFIIASGAYLALSAFYLNKALRESLYNKKMEFIDQSRNYRRRTTVFLALGAIVAIISIFVA